MGGETVRFTVPGRPVPAARMTRRGKWVKRQAQRYLAYKDEVGWAAKQACRMPLQGLLAARIVVYIAGEVYGDCDNYAKSLLDGCKQIVFDDDRQVAALTVIRRAVARGTEQRAEVEIEPWEEGVG